MVVIGGLLPVTPRLVERAALLCLGTCRLRASPPGHPRSPRVCAGTAVADLSRQPHSGQAIGCRARGRATLAVVPITIL